MTRLRLHAPAKLNLGLRVVGRRADGYHLLDTVFQALDLHDTLWLEDDAELSLGVEGDGGGFAVPADASNLVLRAAAAFARASGLPAAGRFHLRKRIPAGGGLGGGSSDAAAALLLLQHRHGAPLPQADLARVAAALGADVPFFLSGGTQRGTGIGELLEPLEPPARRWFVLVVPPFGTSTAAVFENLRAELTHAQPSDRVPRGKAASDRELWASSRLCARWHNDLEAAAERVYPELARLRAALKDAGVDAVSMTGSGSTLFATFADRATAEEGAERMRAQSPPAVRVLVTRTADGMVASRTPTPDRG